MTITSSEITISDQIGFAVRNPTCATALTAAKNTAVQRAQLAPENSPNAAKVMITPRVMCTQPQVVKSPTSTPWLLVTSTLSFSTAVRPKMKLNAPAIARMTPATPAQPPTSGSAYRPSPAALPDAGVVAAIRSS